MADLVQKGAISGPRNLKKMTSSWSRNGENGSARSLGTETDEMVQFLGISDIPLDVVSAIGQYVVDCCVHGGPAKLLLSCQSRRQCYLVNKSCNYCHFNYV